MEQKDFLFPTASNNVYMNNYENNFNLSFLKIERGLSEENASLKEENTKLKIINAELERLATLDGLTGLSNYMRRLLSSIRHRARRRFSLN